MKNIDLLKEYLEIMEKAKSILEYSYEICSNSHILSNESTLTNEELDKLEAMTSRFARLSDILIQRIFRVIENLELESPGTVRDRLNRMEKWGIIDNAEDFLLIRELRNSIAHEYLPDAVLEISKEVLTYTPLLFKTCETVKDYTKKFLFSG